MLGKKQAFSTRGNTANKMSNKNRTEKGDDRFIVLRVVIRIPRCVIASGVGHSCLDFRLVYSNSVEYRAFRPT